MGWCTQSISEGEVHTDSGNTETEYENGQLKEWYRPLEAKQTADPRISLTFGVSSQPYFRGSVSVSDPKEAIRILRNCTAKVYGSKWGGVASPCKVRQWYAKPWRGVVIVCERRRTDDFLDELTGDYKYIKVGLEREAEKKSGECPEKGPAGGSS